MHFVHNLAGSVVGLTPTLGCSRFDGGKPRPSVHLMPASACRPSTLTGRRDERLPHLRPVPHLRQRPLSCRARLRWRRKIGLLCTCAGFCRGQFFPMAACTHLAGIPQSVSAVVSELQCNPIFDPAFSALSQTNQSLEMSAACP